MTFDTKHTNRYLLIRSYSLLLQHHLQTLSPIYDTTTWNATNTKERMDISKMLDYVVLTEILWLHLFHSEQICITISRLKDFQNQVFDIVVVYVCECIPLCSFQFMVFKVFIYIVKIFLLHLFAHCMLTTEKRDFGSSI